jgi:hypothetical protein
MAAIVEGKSPRSVLGIVFEIAFVVVVIVCVVCVVSACVFDRLVSQARFEESKILRRDLYNEHPPKIR